MTAHTNYLNQTIFITNEANYETYFTFSIKVVTNSGIITESEQKSFTYGQYENVDDYLRQNHSVY